MDYKLINRHMDIQMQQQMYRCIDRYSIPPYTCSISQNPMMIPNTCKKFSLFKASFPTPKGTGKIVGELPNYTGNEPTPDIPIAGFGQGEKYIK